MTIERMVGGACGPPFPVYPQLVETLAAAHRAAPEQRDPTVAHVLATAAGDSYADLETVATMMSRLGMEDNHCVRVSQTVDAMLIFSTAYLVQSRCGRVVILSYRGTEAQNLGNWLADADVGSASMRLDDEALGRPLRLLPERPRHAMGGLRRVGVGAPREVAVGPREDARVSVAGAVRDGAQPRAAPWPPIFALSLGGNAERRTIADKLRAVYTFGQPAAVGGPLPASARAVARRLFRHVRMRDPIPVASAGGVGVGSPMSATSTASRTMRRTEIRQAVGAAQGDPRDPELTPGLLRNRERPRPRALLHDRASPASLHRRPSAQGPGHRVRRSRVNRRLELLGASGRMPWLGCPLVLSASHAQRQCKADPVVGHFALLGPSFQASTAAASG